MQDDAEIDRLRELVREFSHVVHGFSHDLREPIRIIACYSELLKNRLSSGNNSTDLREYVHFIHSGVQRTEALLNGILEYARILGADTPVHVPIDMDTVLQTALANLQLTIEATHATVIYDQLPEVCGDFVQLTQLMQNLVGNSLKYRSSESPQILITGVPVDDKVQFSVADNGIGICPEFRETLFIPFKRLHGKEIPGVGLGLAICRHIIELHGGHVWVDSIPGKGTTFYFTLPRQMETSCGPARRTSVETACVER